MTAERWKCCNMVHLMGMSCVGQTNIPGERRRVVRVQGRRRGAWLADAFGEVEDRESV